MRCGMRGGGERVVPSAVRSPIEVLLIDHHARRGDDRERPTRTSYEPFECLDRPRKVPTHPRVSMLGLCWCVGGFSTTARQPKLPRSITRGGRRVKRWWGVISESAVDEPAEPMVALCQSTTYEMIQGQ